MKRDIFARGRGKAATGLLLAIVPGSIAIAAAFAMRRRLQSAAGGADGAEPTELDYQPAGDTFPYVEPQRRWA